MFYSVAELDGSAPTATVGSDIGASATQAEVAINLGENDKAATGIASVACDGQAYEAATEETVGNGQYKLDWTTLTIKFKEGVALGATKDIVIVFNDVAQTTVTITTAAE